MLISVYMPTKNRASLMAEAVDSVLRQTHVDLELLVVDDGSTDDTPALLAKFATQDPRMQVITHAQSQGGAAARNAAIVASKGSFVTGLDDDDTFTPDRLEQFAAAWHAYERAGSPLPSGLYSQLSVVEHGTVVSQTRKQSTATFEDMFRENVVGNQIFAPRQHYIEAGLFRAGLPAWQDLEFFMRILKRFGPARLVDVATYNWDNSPRTDRVSLKSEEKMRAAFEAVCQAHVGTVQRREQMLYLQLFGRFYGVKPTLEDWRRFVRLGFWPRGCARMLREQLR